MGKLKAFAFALAAMMLLASCSARLTLGVAEGGTYRNDYFGFEFEYPNGYHISEFDLPEGATLGGSRTLVLFNAYKYPLESGITGYNPSVKVMAEKVAYMDFGDIKNPTEVDFHELTKATQGLLTERNGLTVSFEYGAILPVNFGGRTFQSMTVNVCVTDGANYNERFSHKFYTIKLKNYMVSVILSYADNAQHDELMGIMRGLGFDT
jgi:hypothetical protein